MSASATQAWFKSHDWSEILQEKFPKKSGNLGNQNEYLELHNVLYMHIYIYVHIYIYISVLLKQGTVFWLQDNFQGNSDRGNHLTFGGSLSISTSHVERPYATLTLPSRVQGWKMLVVSLWSCVFLCKVAGCFVAETLMAFAATRHAGLCHVLAFAGVAADERGIATIQ